MSVKYKDQTIAGRTIAYLPDADVYSTEETVVGRWIDGKPIYRRVFVATTTGAELQDVYYDIENIDLVWLDTQNTFFISSYQGNQLTIPYFSASVVNGSIKATTAVIIQNVYRDHISVRNTDVGLQFYFSLLYIKTTDTATIAIPTAAEMTAAYDEGVQSA